MKRDLGSVVLSVVMVTIGLLHFTHTAGFASIVPDYLPYPEALVLISGVFEIGLGVALQIARTRVLAAYGLVALFIAVFPANINMALHPDQPIAGVPFQPSALALWARLPLQIVLILWAWRYTKRAQSR
ncbi:MAG TPA: hypothetical protein VFX59_29190, partial [Polyangiales bacterium]|nr:hypothetical protein [Polyangiales bacterium]